MGLIFLCGLPGCGKSTVGKAVADELDFSFVDLDEEIENECGRSIIEIFEQDGEALFRVLETQALTRACALGNALVALGAGVLENEGNLVSVLECGRLIYLRASVEVVAARNSNWESRPMFRECNTDAEIIEKLKELLARREKDYLKAEMVVGISANEGVEQVVEKLTALLKAEL